MGANSNIEWTDHTFNPWVGCQKVSEGCKHCYAETIMTRKGRWANTWGPPQTSERLRTSDANWAKPLQWNRWAYKAGVNYRVFCSSLADVFEDNAQVWQWRNDLFRMMEQTLCLSWQVLTKRPENVLKTVPRRWMGEWPKNIWIGTSVENQKTADARIPELLKVPAAVRFLSVEPLLGPVSLDPLGLHWVIVGGESGPGARPMKPEWVRSIRDQCVNAGVPFFFKQWGGVHKKEAGRLLDGREWSEFPKVS